MKYIYIGKIVNTHGIKGELRIISNFKYKDRVFINSMNIYIGKNKDKEIINTYRKHKQFDMITLYDINNINDVLKYKGMNIYIDYDDLRLNKDEYLDDELINLEVIIDNEIMGRVKRIEDYNKYKLIVVNKDEKDYLIPYNNDIIESIDLRKKQIVIKKEIKGMFNI